MSGKYYAVKSGRQPGIYESWKECQEQIYKYSGAVFKAFTKRPEAEAYLQAAEEKAINNNLPLAFIDGTARLDASKRPVLYGWGGFILNGGEIHIVQGTGDNPEYLPERNIAGEVIGLLQVVFKCQRLGIREINVFFDYAGLEQWAAGAWKVKSPMAKYYRDTLQLLEDDVKINFFHVKGHTGITGNEIADALAKQAAGVKLTKKAAALIDDLKAGRLAEFEGRAN